MNKRIPEPTARATELREFLIESYRKRGIEMDLPGLVKAAREVSPAYVKEFIALLELEEYSDK